MLRTCNFYNETYCCPFSKSDYIYMPTPLIELNKTNNNEHFEKIEHALMEIYPYAKKTNNFPTWE